MPEWAPLTICSSSVLTGSPPSGNAHSLRGQSHEPQTVAHILSRSQLNEATEGMIMTRGAVGNANRGDRSFDLKR